MFSLGIVLYEMATGRRPFAGDSSPALISSILRDTPRAVQQRARSAGRRGATSSPVPEKGGARSHPVGARSTRELRGSAPGVSPADRGANRRDVRPHQLDRGAAVHRHGAAKDQGWFCDGIAEEILNALTPLKGLKVAARASAFSFRGKQ